MWSFGLIWLVFALATTLYTSPFPFNMGWWEFTFPLGVYAANTMELGLEMDIMFFKILGTTKRPNFTSEDLKWRCDAVVDVGRIMDCTRSMARKPVSCSKFTKPGIEGRRG
ncbi:hypothetical protein PENNAL_c0009G08708 [Penicillium nalgiovense]|uniref:Uncharacterized protein n=1 Tax=Penicillium nalgiovense TaxID=60175 RepID=A0A1V6YVU4_PENNA|nr:hypothetical protein PENNAL_c0009G08708 [Penicillium nalgiovense]